MRGWILHSDAANAIKPEHYENRRLKEAAATAGIELDLYQPHEFDLTVTRDDRQSLLAHGATIILPDFVLPRMGAGTSYFALAVIRHAERLGALCVNASQAIETVKDKLYTHQILGASNLPVPRTMLAKFPLDVDLVERHLGFPVVVKTLSGSQGSGVYLSQTRSRFLDLMHLIEATNTTANLILQEFVASSHGRDLRVLVIGGRVVACMLRTAPDGEFKANYSQGAAIESYESSPEVEWLATQTAGLLGLDIAGIDLLFDGDHYKVCEANSAPGFEGIERACGVDVAAEIYAFLRIRMGRFE